MPDPIIESIDPDPGGSGQWLIRVNGDVVARLRNRSLARVAAVVGETWSVDRARAAARAERIDRAYASALKTLNRRAQSAAEVSARLTARGFDADEVATTVADLNADGLVDDAALAHAIVDETRRREPVGRARLLARLRNRHIDEVLADDAIAAALAGSDPFDDALAVARQRQPRLAGVPSAVAGRRTAAALARRGFDEDTITSVLERLGLVPDDPS